MRRPGLALIVASLLAGCSPAAKPAPAPAAPVASAPLPPERRLEYPAYASWAKRPVGTAVTFEDVTEIAGVRSVGTTAYKLASLTDAVAVVEVASSGHVVDLPTELKYPRWMSKPEGKAAQFPGAPIGTYEAADETITVRGKEYKCRCYKAKGQVEAGPTETTTWLCDEVPGAQVKCVHQIPAVKKTVTSELVSVSEP